MVQLDRMAEAIAQLNAETEPKLLAVATPRVAFTVPALSLVDQTVVAFEAEGIHSIGG